MLLILVFLSSFFLFVCSLYVYIYRERERWPWLHTCFPFMAASDVEKGISRTIDQLSILGACAF